MALLKLFIRSASEVVPVFHLNSLQREPQEYNVIVNCSTAKKFRHTRAVGGTAL